MFADLILPLALPRLLTYSIPAEMDGLVQPGMRVAVQMGKAKIYSGIVRKLHNDAPQGYDTKPILSVLDAYPLVTDLQLRFWEWLAAYYMCTVGEVMKAALPSGLKMESETKVGLLPDTEFPENLSAVEDTIITVLQAKPLLSINELASLTGRKNVLPPIKSLLEKGVVATEENLVNPYRSRTVTMVQLHPDLREEEKLQSAIENLKRAKKQEQLVLAYLSLQDGELHAPVLKSDLLKTSTISPAVLKACVDKGVFVQTEQVVDRIDTTSEATQTIPNLSEAQTRAFNQIIEGFTEKGKVLLHGVTSSGKTEIYIKLIEKMLAEGKQVLYLLPEIAITVQIISRLKAVFGAKVGVYHSKFSDEERVEVYNSLLNGTYSVVLGVRSSVFLPFSNLGLIIIDEEHEGTFKQNDPAPRYHARDASLVLASMAGANVLMGTATPSIESYYNAQIGKYAIVELTERYGDAQLPQIELVNTLRARKKKRMNGYFSEHLLTEIGDTVARGEQVILFQNRRGFAPFVECKECGHIPKCEHCNVSLTYHKQNNLLVCHYCGYSIQMKPTCQACGSADLQTFGYGTQKIEEELSLLFPDFRIKRMDLDSMRSKSAYERTIAELEQGKIDLLVGTQIVTKGFDFGNVSLVGILNADNLLNFPDFRAYEHSFQLMTQVGGRAGRKDKPGKVIIQTSNHENPIILQVLNGDYKGMYNQQLSERQLFHYPPFHRLIEITLKHADNNVLQQAATQLNWALRKVFADRVLGPESPLVDRIQNRYLINFRLKIEKEKQVDRAKTLLDECLNFVRSQKTFASLQVVIDVDPL